jgi:hypothetical protein
MKRRNFLKGLAALVVVPVAALTSTTALATTDTSPAKVAPLCFEKVDVPTYNMEATDAMGEALRKLGESSQKARKATQEMQRSLDDLYMSPESWEDMRNWGVDQIDEQTRKELFSHQVLGHARLDNRAILRMNFDGSQSQAPELWDGLVSIDAPCYDRELTPEEIQQLYDKNGYDFSKAK